jgi:CheY-like chemotaxis protein
MPAKILLADKSITIQKVVEMLFSGKEYEVICASDGESALAEASRMMPNVVLADVDLPRVDGYSFSARLRQNPALAKTPVILMLSRDDVYDAAKGTQTGIVDSISKPFESQELIGKVKKALAGAPAEPTGQAPFRPAPAAQPKQAPPPPPGPKPAVPTNIFDIIEEAPARSDIPPAAAAPESLFEVEPEVEVEAEVIEEPPRPAGAMKPGPQPELTMPPLRSAAREQAEQRPVPGIRKPVPAPPAGPSEEQLFGVHVVEPLAPEAEKILPFGDKAVAEMREGLGLGNEQAAEALRPEIVSFESLDAASRSAEEYAPPAGLEPLSGPAPSAEPAFPAFTPPPGAREIPDDLLRSVAREAVERIVRDVVEKVAWEVIPDLAERLIREEIERLKKER